MPAMAMNHETDPRDQLLKKLGDISSVEVFNNQVLVAVYERPEKTKTGIVLPQAYRDEDKFQGKAALIVAMGPAAFQDADGRWFQGANLKTGDWILLRPSDGWPVTVNGTLCRMLNDTAVRARIDRPDRVW